MKKYKINKFSMAAPVIFVVLGMFLFSIQTVDAKDGKKSRKILYYRNPMNPAITSDVPAKDHMGMDYIPVYEEEASSKPAESNVQNIVKLSERDIFLAGVSVEPVTFKYLFKEIRTVGRIAYDPELYKAEEELIQAVNAKQDLEKSQISEVKARIEALIEAARFKLRLSGLSEDQINEVSVQKKADRSLIISDKESPYVWVYADVYEYELSWIKVNLPIKIVSQSFPGEEFKGKVEAIDPVLDPMTRSVRIRAKIENPELKLKPQMYVDIFIESYLTDSNGKHLFVLALPIDALLDTGMRKVVYLDLGGGSYLGKEVEVGPEAVAFIDGKKQRFYPVVSGLKENDKVVTRANFLIDSQSQISGVAAAAYGGALGSKEETRPPEHQH